MWCGSEATLLTTPDFTSLAGMLLFAATLVQILTNQRKRHHRPHITGAMPSYVLRILLSST